MKRASVVAVCAAALVAGLAAAPFAPSNAKKAQVMVHCPTPSKPEGWVTPPRITIAVGDSLVWRTTGAVTDTLVITLKNPSQGWPFSGGATAGSASVQTGPAVARGTYGYNVHYTCRLPGGGSQTVDIDPDIIIE